MCGRPELGGPAPGVSPIILYSTVQGSAASFVSVQIVLRRVCLACPGAAAAKGTQGTQQLAEALRTVPGSLPDRAGIEQEVAWVAAHMHDPSPVLDTSPSRAAVALLMGLKFDDRLRRDFWTIALTKRLSPGERRHKSAAFAEDQDTVTDDEHDAGCMRWLSGS